MPCLYACAAVVRDYHALKFGISKYDEPWHRLASHRATLTDHPFGCRIDPFAFLSIRVPHIWVARFMETAIKRLALVALPRNPPWTAPPILSVVDGRQPSGEWLVCAEGDEGIGQFYSLALLATREPETQRYAPTAYEAFFRAACAWHAGDPYSDLALPRSN